MAKKKKPKKASADFSQIGYSGLQEFSGRIQEDFLRELRGLEGYKKYREMTLNSPIIGAELLAVEQAIRGVSWSFNSGIDDDPRVEFLEEAIEGMSHSWKEHVTEALSMLPFGYSIFEIVYKRDGVQILWDKLAVRGQDTVTSWDIGEHGNIRGFRQQAPPTYNLVTLPIEKLILYRTRLERNNPEGRSILRTAWVSYYYAKHHMQIESIGVERDVAGLPMITLPPNADLSEATNSDFSKAKKMVRNIRNDEQAGIVKPTGWELELLSAGGTTGSGKLFDTDKIIRRYESRMLMATLSQFLMLGQENVGSLALSKDQTDFFTMSVNTTADIFAETFSKYAIPRLLTLNGFDTGMDSGSRLPPVKLEHTPAGDVDVNLLADFLQKVGPMITFTPEDEIWLRSVARMPEKELEELIQARKEAEARRMEEANNRFGNNDEDEMHAVQYFGADAPDDETRRKWERKWERTIREYFEGAQKRILKGAKELKK